MEAEAAGLGVDTEHHAATLTKGPSRCSSRSLMDVLQDAHGQILEAFSISAGLDYPGIGPEHSHYHDTNVPAMPCDRRRSFRRIPTLVSCGRDYPSLESSHAIAFAVKLAKDLGPDKSMIVCLSGRWGQGCGSSQGPLGSRCSKEGRSSCLRHLTEKLNAIKAAGKGIFVPYIMAGDHEKGLMVWGNNPLFRRFGCFSH